MKTEIDYKKLIKLLNTIPKWIPIEAGCELPDPLVNEEGVHLWRVGYYPFGDKYETLTEGMYDYYKEIWITGTGEVITPTHWCYKYHPSKPNKLNTRIINKSV